MRDTPAIRQMLEGFVKDPPDNDFQAGFLAATITIANEIMGIAHDDPLILAAEGKLDELSRMKRFTIIEGGRPQS
jgi:hypothetical protein